MVGGGGKGGRKVVGGWSEIGLKLVGGARLDCSLVLEVWCCSRSR